MDAPFWPPDAEAHVFLNSMVSSFFLFSNSTISVRGLINPFTQGYILPEVISYIYMHTLPNARGASRWIKYKVSSPIPLL